MFEALVFTIFACEFRPRCALEIDDASQTRIDKIYAIIGESRYGIHDLSRTELDGGSCLPRFNMPMELGIFLGAKRFGDETQTGKRCLILDVERYRYQRFISDIAGMDIRDHGGEPEQAVRRVRDWLANVSRRKLPGPAVVVGAWKSFVEARPGMAEVAGLDPNDIPYADLEALIVGWLSR